VSAASAAFMRKGLGVGEGLPDPPRPLAAPEHQPTFAEMLAAALARRASIALTPENAPRKHRACDQPASAGRA
jgi:hypothetical protein